MDWLDPGRAGSPGDNLKNLSFFQKEEKTMILSFLIQEKLRLNRRGGRFNFES